MQTNPKTNKNKQQQTKINKQAKKKFTFLKLL
jgi:hypothetical protein